MSKTEKAFILPFAVFLGFLALVQLVQKVTEGSDAFWLESPQYWIFPIQTVVCGILLFRYRLAYSLAIRSWGLTLGIGLAVFLIWISPQAFFGAAPRLDGFNPGAVGPNPLLTGSSLLFRLLRLVIVVPLVEEIFWRGYLLRYLIDQDFNKVPVGTFSWKSFTVVTIAFVLVHNPADYPAAAITGVLYNGLACWTKSVGSCVLAHALTNALLGGYILATGQWGFW